MSKIEGIRLVLPAKAKGKLSTASATKVYLVEELSDIPLHELKGVTSFGVPEANADGVLSITVTMPLLEVVYAEE
jgi:hypothetical protein